ncbi:hypothetical protein [Corynebacterium mastitidis]|uniref:hypothetical protein n=1 Tax=Corynebacterium mastitidis TaxID=161890 RepID=UPI0012EAF4C0|nr:hypothetical protein [Corynebacterium mastitidis]
MPNSRYLAGFCLTVGIALILRTESLGDGLLDNAIAQATSWHNVPDLVGHLCSLLAMMSLACYFALAAGMDEIKYIAAMTTGAFGFLLICFWYRLGGAETSMINMMLAPGMQPYNVIFSSAILITQFISLGVLLTLIKARSVRTQWILLGVGALGGVAMALHRLMTIAFPTLTETYYLPLAWSFALLCAGGYIAAAAMLITPRPARETA